MKINSSCCRVVLWQDASSPSSPPGFFSHPSCGAESQGRRLRGLHIDAWQVRQHLKTLCIKKHSVHFSFEMVVLANSTQPTIQLTTGSVQLYPRRMKQIYPRLKQHSRSSANHWSWRKTGIFKRATFENTRKNYRFCYYLGATADAATGNLGAMSKPLSWGMPRLFHN